MATTTFTFYTVAWQGQDGISAPGLAVPLPDEGDGAVGTSTSFARQDHVHPVVVEEIGVGTTPSDLIQPVASGLTLTASYARRQGKVAVFSFAATLSEALPAFSLLFQTDESIIPGAAISFIILDSAGKGQFGNFEGVTYVYPDPQPSVTQGELSCLSALPAGSIRGELVWMIEPEEEE